MNHSLMKIDDFENIKSEKNICFFPTRFNFLKMQNGLRPKYMHVLIGQTGMGKSTLVRSIALDCCRDPNFKALIWLTEETSSDYTYELNYQTHEKQLLLNMHVVSELDFTHPPNDIDSYLRLIEHTVIESKCSVLFFDNFTTSRIIQNLGIKAEGDLATRLRVLAMKLQIALVVVAHTRKGTMNGPRTILTSDDVRGNATLVNTAQFIYVLQPIFDKTSRVDYVFVNKARGYPNHMKNFALRYDIDLKTYIQDRQINIEDVYNKLRSANELMRGKDETINTRVGKQGNGSWHRD